MADRGEISDIVDSLLRFSIFGGVIAAGLVAPNSLQVLEKPALKYFKKLDKQKRERELRKVVRYMRNNGLLEGDYQHGLQITKKGKERLKKREIEELSINKPNKWDKKWRIILFDIPETKKTGRDSFTRKLKHMGFYQLQKSVWLYPYSCRAEIECASVVFEVDKYITYIETSFIDKQAILQNYFKLKS